MQTLILSQSDVESLIDMELALSATEAAFVAEGNQTAQMPVKVYLSLEKEQGDFRAMPAYMDGFAGVKWVNSHPNNPTQFQMPAVMGAYILSDAKNAMPLALMDATSITAYRTGAAAAVASKYLCGKTPKTIAMIGCGVQAKMFIGAHRVLYPEASLLMHDRSEAAAKRLADEEGGRAVSLDDAAKADIVCIATPSRQPVLLSSQVGPGTHINAMGADAPGKQEVDPAILHRAQVVIDDYHQAEASGEINVPLSKGEFKLESVAGTIGEIIVGKKSGRKDAEAITVFDSTGLAIQDVALARALYDRANDRGVGTRLDFVNPS